MVIPDRLRPEPLLRVEPKSKEPVLDNYAVEDTTEVIEWIEQGGNAGISLANTSTVVVDVDDREVAKEVLRLFPETFTVETGSGWYHRYYHCPEWSGNKKLTEDSSIRSDGWMAVIPPSVHPDGGRYSVHRELPVAKIEEWRLGELSDEFCDEEGGHPHPDRDNESRQNLDELAELIRHDGYRQEVRDVLNDPQAGHNRRVWLAGFLSDAVGLSISETVRVIDQYNSWSNYDREITEQQVRSVVGGGNR